jgi:hypothetical protein
MSTNRKNTNVWGIPNEIHREDRKRINLTAIIKIYSLN